MKKNINNTIIIGFLMIVCIVFFTACEEEGPNFRTFEYPELVVDGFSPKSGRPGTLVSITGSNFGEVVGAAHIFFNGVEIAADNIISYSDTEIVVKVPEETTSGLITINVWKHTKVTAESFEFIEGAKYTTVSQSRAQVGEIITITGENFGTDAGAVQLFIGSVEVDVASVSDTEITFVVPDIASGDLVLNIGGQEITGDYFLIGDDLLTGTLIGHSGSWGNNAATMIAAAVDGDITTAVDAPSSKGYVGYDMGANKAALLTSVRYVPRTSHPQRMVGGEIRGANDPTLYDYVVLHTITDAPPVGVYSEAAISTTESYRYIYYYSPDGFCNIAEIEFYGNEVDAVIPVGKFVYEFDNATDPNYWVGLQNATNVIEDGKLKVTFDAAQFAGTSKRRADLKFVEGGTFPASSPTGLWRYGSEYPILAFKITFTGTGAAVPGTGSVKLDRFNGAQNNAYLTDYLANNVIYYDCSIAGGFTESQDLASFQLKIADITSTEETGYEVDWIRTFKTVAELEAFLQQ